MLKFLRYLYLTVGAMEMAASLTGNEQLHYIAKPLLMPVLIALYLQSTGGRPDRVGRLMIAALAFSWIGDVALMFRGASYFLIGLIGFLITHVLYITAFTLVPDRSSEPLLKRKIWILAPLIAYMAGLLSVVFPAIGPEMKIPVAIYTIILGLMVVSALNRYKRVNDSSFALVFGGALLFMFSDSLLAVNKFMYHGSLFMAGAMIMLLYISGQYLITKGILRNEIID